MKEKILHMSQIFKILSNDIRLCILVNIIKKREVKVTDLQECVGASQSLVSQQLAKLRLQDIIEANKKGKEVYYSLKDEKIKEIIEKIVLN